MYRFKNRILYVYIVYPDEPHWSIKDEGGRPIPKVEYYDKEPFAVLKREFNYKFNTGKVGR